MAVMSRLRGTWFRQVVLVAAGGTLIAATVAVGIDAWLRAEYGVNVLRDVEGLAAITVLDRRSP